VQRRKMARGHVPVTRVTLESCARSVMPSSTRRRRRRRRKRRRKRVKREEK
jgi:hypothetical protein